AHAREYGRPMARHEYIEILAGIRSDLAAHSKDEQRSILDWLAAVRQQKQHRVTPSFSEILDVLEFKRDSIMSSSTTIFRREFADSEIVRSSIPGEESVDISLTSVRRRMHSGPNRFTSNAWLLPSGQVEPTVSVASNGNESLVSNMGGEPVRSQAMDYAQHREPLAWESIGCMLGSRARGTARHDEHDLAATLRRMGIGMTWIDLVRSGEDAKLLVRLQLGFGPYPWTVLLDPARGLSVLRSTKSSDDGEVTDELVHEFTDFKQSRFGLQYPTTVTVQQHRSRMGAGKTPMDKPRLVYEVISHCIEFEIKTIDGLDQEPLELVFRSENEKSGDSYKHVSDFHDRFTAHDDVALASPESVSSE
ncbi:MAG: hypothetical protein CMJ32_04320, partial [Phycisphaerae bacterium]|nr:hypothetical protein [Phycisphaerae bacterium]